MQVASQFNALESVTPIHNPLRKYPLDRTQGPRCVMPCANALLRRHVSGFDAFSHIFPDRSTRERFLKHGYVQWGSHPEEFAAELQRAGNDYINRLLILPQWTRAELVKGPPASDTVADADEAAFIQVFSAAPPTGHQGNRGNWSVQQQIAMDLVVPQYRSLAKLAVLRSRAICMLLRLNIASMFLSLTYSTYSTRYLLVRSCL